MSRLLLTLSLLFALSLPAQDAELFNYRSGISLVWGGTKGTDYDEEYLFQNPAVWGAKVVYIRDTTSITASHNTNNIAGTANGSDSYTAVGTDVGIIKYKVDGDRRFGLTVPNWSTYSAPFDFGDLNYGLYGDSGVAVVGSTGTNGVELTWANRTSYYHRGVEDEFGDEWHTLTVADDDRNWRSGGDAEFSASDGKVFHFVVNPKTPSLRLRTNAPTGQFYTTPAKKYFVPRIYSQTSYINDQVQFQLTDLYGSNVVHRINGGAWSTNASGHTLTSSSFTDGGVTNTFEYFSDRGTKPVKTRLVVRNPAYPSAAEAHGDRLWVGPTYWTNEVRPRLLATGPALDQVNSYRSFNNNSFTPDSGQRNGRVNGYGPSLQNALVARIDGMTATGSGQSRSYALNAKLEIMESEVNLDPVGMEFNIASTGTMVPTAELFYRGYYDVDQVVSAAAAYDILIGHYRSDQGFASGITAIEDHYLRDMLASWVHVGSLLVERHQDMNPGMWDTAWRIGAAFCAAMMPAYSTEYYGTSGLDGNTQTWPDNPFPTAQHTWKQLFFDNDYALPGFPDPERRLGIEEYNVNTDGRWLDRIGYSNTPLMGHTIVIYYNLLKLFQPAKTLPRTDLMQALGAAGQLTGMKFTTASDYNQVFRAWAAWQSAWFPDFRDVAQPTMLSLPSNQNESIRQLFTGGPLFVLWYDHNLPLGQETEGPTNPPPPAEGPAAPTALNSVPASTSVLLTWTDNASDETGFEISWGEDGVSFLTLASTPANTTSYTVQNLVPGLRYYFRIRAERDGVFSAWSNVLSVETLPTVAGPTNPTGTRRNRSKSGGAVIVNPF
jgi:hypothetical protein